VGDGREKLDFLLVAFREFLRLLPALGRDAEPFQPIPEFAFHFPPAAALQTREKDHLVADLYFRIEALLLGEISSQNDRQSLLSKIGVKKATSKRDRIVVRQPLYPIGGPPNDKGSQLFYANPQFD
jgi:hypothetical protein